MKRNLFLYILFNCIFLSCSNTHPEILDARIFERKLLPNDSMMIYYVFAMNGLIFKDSAELKNDIVLKDSVSIQCSSKASGKTTVLLP